MNSVSKIKAVHLNRKKLSTIQEIQKLRLILVWSSKLTGRNPVNLQDQLECLVVGNPIKRNISLYENGSFYLSRTRLRIPYRHNSFEKPKWVPLEELSQNELLNIRNDLGLDMDRLAEKCFELEEKQRKRIAMSGVKLAFQRNCQETYLKYVNMQGSL